VHKNTLFLLKDCKNLPVLEASGGWELRPQPPFENPWLCHCIMEYKYLTVHGETYASISSNSM